MRQGPLKRSDGAALCQSERAGNEEKRRVKFSTFSLSQSLSLLFSPSLSLSTLSISMVSHTAPQRQWLIRQRQTMQPVLPRFGPSPTQNRQTFEGLGFWAEPRWAHQRRLLEKGLAHTECPTTEWNRNYKKRRWRDGGSFCTNISHRHCTLQVIFQTINGYIPIFQDL